MHPQGDERSQTVATTTRRTSITVYQLASLTAPGQPGHNRSGHGREDTAIQTGAGHSPQPKPPEAATGRTRPLEEWQQITAAWNTHCLPSWPSEQPCSPSALGCFQASAPKTAIREPPRQDVPPSPDPLAQHPPRRTGSRDSSAEPWRSPADETPPRLSGSPSDQARSKTPESAAASVRPVHRPHP